jgi:hypothetical protein
MQRINQTLEPRPAQRRHNFEQYADGNWYKAELGVDFDNLASYRATLNAWCHSGGARIRQLGYEVRCETYRTGDDLAFRIYNLWEARSLR